LYAKQYPKPQDHLGNWAGKKEMVIFSDDYKRYIRENQATSSFSCFP
jgi:hypothetical protein